MEGYKKKGSSCELPLIGMTGFEPATFWSQTKRATSCATSRNVFLIYTIYKLCSIGL